MSAWIHCQPSLEHHVFQVKPIRRQRCAEAEIARQYARQDLRARHATRAAGASRKRSRNHDNRRPHAGTGTRQSTPPAAGTSLVERWFKLGAHQTDVRTELLAGPTLFKLDISAALSIGIVNVFAG